MTSRAACLASIALWRDFLGAILCAVVIAASPLDAAEPTRFVKELHGIQPGSATLDDLQASEKWGAPARTRHLDPLTMELTYVMPPWRNVLVIVRGDVVRAIDLLPPGGFEPHELIEAFELGALQLARELPPGADLPVSTTENVTYHVSDRTYVVVLARAEGGRSSVERIRLYLPGSGPDLILPGEEALDMAPLKGPTDTARLAAKTAASVLPVRHISRHPLDDEIGQRTWTLYLASLDPGKLIFTRADVDRWQSQTLQADDDLKRGELARFWDAAAIARQRAAERLRLVAELLREPVDFQQDEMYRRDQTRDAYASTDADLRERWRQFIKFQLLIHRSADADEYETRLRVWRTQRAEMSALTELDDDGVLQLTVRALANAYDPSSNYRSVKEQEKLLADLRAALVGIGAGLRSQMGYPTVDFTVEDSPAGRAGLQPGDRVLSVAQGDQGLWRNAVGEPLAKVIQQIRGATDSVVQLRVLPRGMAATRVVRLVRAPIQFTPVQGAVLTPPTIGEGRAEKLGYIKLPQFYLAAAIGGDKSNPASSSRDVRQLLSDFASRHVDAVVLDLRSNTGGVLSELDALTGLFTGPGPVRQWRLADGKTGIQNANEAAVWTGPLVVLTDSDTGSGGEILAAALADRNRALVVGAAQTVGNGTMRNFYPLEQFQQAESPPPLGSIEISEISVYRINGESLQQAGVRPHIVLPPSQISFSLFGQKQDRDLPQALKFDRIAPVADRQPHQYAISPELRRWLQQRTNERQATSAEFRAAAETWTASRQADVVPLHEEDFRIWYDSFHPPTEVEILPGTRNVRFDHHLREALSITLDYLEHLKGS